MCLSCNFEDAIEQCDFMLDDDSLSFAFDFITSVREWIVNNHHVTPKQLQALHNIVNHSHYSDDEDMDSIYEMQF